MNELENGGHIRTLLLMATRPERGVYAASFYVNPKANCCAGEPPILKRPEGRAPGAVGEPSGSPRFYWIASREEAVIFDPDGIRRRLRR